MVQEAHCNAQQHWREFFSLPAMAPWVSKKMFYRYDWKTELVLVTMPSVIIISVLLLLETFSNQQLLFSSLASSAFLIYLDPKHPTNSIRTLVIAQLSACVLGYLIYLLIGAGYLSATISMILCIALMIFAKAMHPPAVSTALIFAFQYKGVDAVLMFALAVMLLVVLVVLQKTSLWLIKKAESKRKPTGTHKEYKQLKGTRSNQ